MWIKHAVVAALDSDTCDNSIMNHEHSQDGDGCDGILCISTMLRDEAPLVTLVSFELESVMGGT